MGHVSLMSIAEYNKAKNNIGIIGNDMRII